MNIQEAIQAVTEDRDLSRDDMESVMREIMTGVATPAQIGGFLIGLRMKGETIDEITAAAGVMRSLATRVEVDVPHLVDTCGTGGDSSGTFNVSTASAFVAAAAGAHVAKHGNRSVSSRSGSADLLEAAGVRIDLDAAQVARCIRDVGVGFMFAPLHHRAMKHAIGPRKEMGVRTIFNLLGPLSNPATAPNQVLGVFSEQWVEPLARTLRGLGSEHVLVVHAEDGLDEISVAAPTQVAELRAGQVSMRTVTPEELGVTRGALQDIVVDGAEASLALIRRAFDNEAGAARDIIALNGGAAIYAAGLADSLNAGVARAFDVLADGSAGRKLEQLADFSQGL